VLHCFASFFILSLGSDKAKFMNYLHNHSKNQRFSCLEATFKGQKEHYKELATA